MVDLLGDIPMNDRDANGDLYEYLLSNQVYTDFADEQRGHPR